MGDDFAALGDFFLKIAGQSDSQLVDEVFIKFGNALQTLGENLAGIDFHKIVDDFRQVADSGVTDLDQVFMNGADFLALGEDTLKLDTSMQELAHEFLKINDLLQHLKLEQREPIPGDQGPVLAVTDQLHHANDFHL